MSYFEGREVTFCDCGHVELGEVLLLKIAQ